MRFEMTVDGEGDAREALVAVARVATIHGARVNGQVVDAHSVADQLVAEAEQAAAALAAQAQADAEAAAATEAEVAQRVAEAALDGVTFASPEAKALAVAARLTTAQLADSAEAGQAVTAENVQATIDKLRAEG